MADLAEEGAAEKLVADAGDLDVLVANAALPGVGAIESFSEGRGGRDPAGQLRVPDPDGARDRAEAGRTGRGSHRLHLLAHRQGWRRRVPSIYSATKFGLRGFALALREDLLPRVSASRSSRPGSCARRGCSTTPARRPLRALDTTTPKKVGQAVLTRDPAQPNRDRGRAPATAPGHGVRHRHPELAARVQSRGGAEKIAEDLVAGHGQEELTGVSRTHGSVILET